MEQNLESPLSNIGEIKREIAEAIRVAIQERADELGIGYEACIDLLLKKET